MSGNNGTYRFGRFDIDEMRLIDSFKFNYCDDSACSGCCKYFVEVTITGLVTAVILVDNVHITALVA